MNSLPQTEQNTPERKADIERLMRENDVKPFVYDEAVGEGEDLWTDKEFDEFQNWLREQRRENRQQEKMD